LGVTQENPQAYVQQYGAQLLDAQTLLQQARAAGVVEDIVSKIRVQLAVSMISLFLYLVTTRWCRCSQS